MNREQRVAAGLGLFAVTYMVASWRLPRFGLGTAVVDAHVFHLVLGAVLLVLSVLYFLQSARLSAPSKPLLEGVNKILLAKLIGAALVYALVLGKLGYLIATTLFVVGVMLLLGRRRYLPVVAVGAGFSAVTYFIFAYVLDVPLARGILPF